MTHQCPKCELRFSWPTELDDHCRAEHPEFHHDYPARTAQPDLASEVVHVAGEPIHAPDAAATDVLGTYWNER